MKQPNILIIVADQQRYDCIGWSGGYPVKTPNIDRMAEEGAWFSNAYTVCPVCGPARQSLLNGRRPEAFGANWNQGLGLKVQSLTPDDYCWVRELKNIGYKTAFIGKWCGTGNFGPLDFGFDKAVSTNEYYDYRKIKYPDVKYTGGWLGETDKVPSEDNISCWFADRAIEYIKENMESNDGPWHLRLDFPGPHLPCRPSKEFAEMYNPDEVPMWGSFKEDFINKPYIQKQMLYNWGIEDLTWKEWSGGVAHYYGVISEIDHAIGTVLDFLKRSGTDDNTLVIYTADHGDMCGSHRMIDKHYVLYEDVVHIPFVVRWPGVVPKGIKIDDYVYQSLDIPPTILEVLSVDIPDFFHGMSLMTHLKGNKPEIWRQEAVSTCNGQQFGLYTQRMIRTGVWKYIWNMTDIDELYKLDDDPYELNNLIYSGEYGDILARLRNRLYNVLEKEGDGLVESGWLRRQLLENKKL